MDKLLLCWRYLQTRYLAMACIISVMLGVGTLIVVNGVMTGFSKKLKERLHGLLSDVLVEALTYDGFPDPAGKVARIMTDPFLKERVEATTSTLEVFAMLQFSLNGETIMRPVRLIGVDPETRSKVGGFVEHLARQKNAPHPSFDLDAEARLQNTWRHQNDPRGMPVDIGPVDQQSPPPPAPPPSQPKVAEGAIIGYAIGNIRRKKAHAGCADNDVCILRPGDDVWLTTIRSTVNGERLAPICDRFAVCDYFKSEMSEYDSNYVFVPLNYLQSLRNMDGRVTSIQMRLKDYNRDAKAVKERLRELFPQEVYMVETWEDKQGPLLAAIAIERGILNVLLFLIVGVAGFGILAIFTMIVVEKTRDIGILKSLGASHYGVMQIFLAYGLLLGVIGALLGTGLGLLITNYINEIEMVLGRWTGQDIFPRDIYYFDSIPYYIDPLQVVLINIGAVTIAVVFSVLPALRAAMLHPVRALRYE